PGKEPLAKYLTADQLLDASTFLVQHAADCPQPGTCGKWAVEPERWARSRRAVGAAPGARGQSQLATARPHTKGRVDMDRRKFLRFSAGGAAGAAIGASLAYMNPFSHSPEKEAGRLEVPTTCEACVNK